MMRLEYSAAARTAIGSLNPAAKKRVRAAIRRLHEDPRASELNLKRLALDDEAPAVYRCRVGDYRIAFAFDHERLRIHAVFHRRDGYGWLERY